MKKLFILLAMVLMVGCKGINLIEEDYTIKLSKKDCDKYTGRGLSCGSDYKDSTKKLSTYINAVVSKRLSDEKDYSVGEFYYYQGGEEWGYWTWSKFKREDIVDRVDGYSKFKALAYYEGDIWVSNKCLFYYKDYRPKPPSPFKKIREDIVGRAKEEYKKMKEE